MGFVVIVRVYRLVLRVITRLKGGVRVIVLSNRRFLNFRPSPPRKVPMERVLNGEASSFYHVLPTAFSRGVYGPNSVLPFF